MTVKATVNVIQCYGSEVLVVLSLQFLMNIQKKYVNILFKCTFLCSCMTAQRQNVILNPFWQDSVRILIFNENRFPEGV